MGPTDSRHMSVRQTGSLKRGSARILAAVNRRKSGAGWLAERVEGQNLQLIEDET